MPVVIGSFEDGPATSSVIPKVALPASDPAGNTPVEFDWDEEGGRNSAARLRERLLALTDLARRDPVRALSLAEAARFEGEREALVLAAYEGWGAYDVEAALSAALSLDGEDMEAAVEAALSGAAENPAAARGAIEGLKQGGVLSSAALRRLQFAFVGALAQEGHFEDAIGQGLAESNASDRKALLSLGFAEWGRYEPEAAMSAAMEVEEVSDREEAYSVVTGTWSGVDPEGLAVFAEQLPHGKERSMAMKRALKQWVDRSPTEAADWLEKRGPAKELDIGVHALATHPYLAERSPEVAVSWAESLWDDNLRAETVALVVKQWAATDRASAIEYVRSNPEIGLVERQELLALFGERKEFDIDGRLR